MLSDALPETSFVSFAVPKLRDPYVLWRAPAVEEELVSRSAYCMPMDGDNLSRWDLNDQRIFLGERYGGTGIGVNGGGGRCGLINGVQIKGIGRNPLAAPDSSFWHSYGGESLTGAIIDAIWGEICSLCLPFGGVRVLGVVDTGTTVPRFGRGVEQGGDNVERRGLALREPALRPAHYIRSLYFNRQTERACGLPTDAERTRQAIAMVHVGFMSAGYDSESSSVCDTINFGLLSFARRLARQQATSRAKRIVHGAITPSNICLDGRWIDYATTSAVSDYGRIIVAKGGRDASDFGPVLEVVCSLWRSVSRNMPHPLTKRLLGIDELTSVFETEYREAVRTEFLKLSGIPEAALSRSDKSNCEKLYECFRQLATIGTSEPFKLYSFCPVKGAIMPEKMGTYSLPRAMQTALSTECPKRRGYLLDEQIPDVRLRSDLVRSLNELIEGYLAGRDPKARAHALGFLRCNGLRKNSTLEFLYRHRLKGDVRSVVDNDGDVGKLINSTVARATSHLQEATEGKFELICAGGEKVVVTEDRPITLDGTPISDVEHVITLANLLEYGL